MTLDEILKMIEGSTVTDWHKMNVSTTYGWTSGQDANGNYLEPNTHNYLAVFKPDVDVSIAFDATVADPYDEPWVRKFAAPRALSVAIWFRYRGAVVYEQVGVVVDGGRYLLPMPRPVNQGFEVDQATLPLARLLFDLYGVGGPHQPVEDALAHAGVTIV